MTQFVDYEIGNFSFYIMPLVLLRIYWFFSWFNFPMLYEKVSLFSVSILRQIKVKMTFTITHYYVRECIVLIYCLVEAHQHPKSPNNRSYFAASTKIVSSCYVWILESGKAMAMAKATLWFHTCYCLIKPMSRHALSARI